MREHATLASRNGERGTARRQVRDHATPAGNSVGRGPMGDAQPERITQDLQRDFGLAVRAARQRSGLSQEELGNRIGADQNRVSAVERGCKNVKLSTIWAIADALSMHPAELLGARETHDERPGEATDSDPR